MLKIGITGGIGSGKSVVCKIFECLGVPVFHADAEGRKLLSEDAETQKKVTELFGKAVLTDGKLDRKKIADIVFNDAQKLAELNSIIHPAVRKSFGNWVAAQSSAVVAEEVAILFESGADKGLDATIVVTAPEKLKIERATKRDKITEAEVRARMQRQWSEEEKVSRADYNVVNDNAAMIIPQVLNIYKDLSSKYLSKKPTQ